MARKVYSTEDYQFIYQTVLDYQAKVPGAADILVDSFEDFIWKYVNLICRGTYKMGNKSIRSFIGIFAAANKKHIKTSQNLSEYGFKPVIKTIAKETSNMIVDIFSAYNPIEIKNELIDAFLQMATKYHDYSRPSFHTYVQRNFHFYAFRTLEKLIKDPINRRYKYEPFESTLVDCHSEVNFIKVNENLSYEQTKAISTLPITNSELSPYDTESLNIDWINGATCGDLFKNLSPLYRDILVMHYIEKQTDEQVARKFGLCRATINRKRKIAVQMVKENLKNQD